MRELEGALKSLKAYWTDVTPSVKPKSDICVTFLTYCWRLMGTAKRFVERALQKFEHCAIQCLYEYAVLCVVQSITQGERCGGILNASRWLLMFRALPLMDFWLHGCCLDEMLGHVKFTHENDWRFSARLDPIKTRGAMVQTMGGTINPPTPNQHRYREPSLDNFLGRGTVEYHIHNESHLRDMGRMG